MPYSRRTVEPLRAPWIEARILLGLGLLIVMSPAGAAGPMVQVDDLTHTFTESAPPFNTPLVLDETFSSPGFGDGRAFATSGPLDVLRANLESPRNAHGSYSVDSRLSDTFFVSGPGGPIIGPITVHFVAHGTMTLPATDDLGVGGTGTAELTLGIAGGGSGINFDEVALTTNPGTALEGIPLVSPGTIPVDLSTVVTYDNDPINGRSLSFILGISGFNAAVDFSHTAEVFFDLPPGETVTSDGGFFQSGGAIPEPSSMLMLAIGSVLLGAAAWRRRTPRGTTWSTAHIFR